MGNTSRPQASDTHIDEARRFERCMMERIRADGAYELVQDGAQRLLLIQAPANTNPEALCQVIIDSLADADENALVQVFSGRIAVLIQVPKRNEAKVFRKQLNSLLSQALASYPDTIAGASQIFDSINDLTFAYRQACIALAHWQVPDRLLRRQGEDRRMIGPTIPFSLVLPALLAHGKVPYDLLRYTLENGLIRRLNLKESRSGISTADLVWAFLLNGCNARKAAERLYVHRNTVAYHIRSIEQNYGISFDDPLVCSCLRLECLHVLSSD